MTRSCGLLAGQRTARFRGGQLPGQLGADLVQPGDQLVDLGELAPVHLPGVGAAGPAGVAGAQALQVRPGLLQREAELGQLPDLDDEAQVTLVVLAVAVGPPARRQQAQLLVVAQCPRAHPGPAAQLSDPHPDDAKPSPRRERQPAVPPPSRSVASSQSLRTRRRLPGVCDGYATPATSTG